MAGKGQAEKGCLELGKRRQTHTTKDPYLGLSSSLA